MRLPDNRVSDRNFHHYELSSSRRGGHTDGHLDRHKASQSNCPLVEIWWFLSSNKYQMLEHFADVCLIALFRSFNARSWSRPRTENAISKFPVERRAGSSSGKSSASSCHLSLDSRRNAACKSSSSLLVNSVSTRPSIIPRNASIMDSRLANTQRVSRSRHS